MELVRDIAGGVDVGGAGATQLVDEDAVLLRDRRREGRYLGLDPDADDREVAGDAIAGGGHGRLHPLGPLEGGDLTLGEQLDAVRAVERGDRRADLLAEHPFEGHAARERPRSPEPRAASAKPPPRNR